MQRKEDELRASYYFAPLIGRSISFPRPPCRTPLDDGAFRLMAALRITEHMRGYADHVCDWACPANEALYPRQSDYEDMIKVFGQLESASCSLRTQKMTILIPADALAADDLSRMGSAAYTILSPAVPPAITPAC
jgi:hypothetical protein